jgi:hypothetical protein
MKNIFRHFLLALAFCPALLTAQSTPFAKFFTFPPNNPLATMTFITSHQLKNNNGFLILAERYNVNSRNSFLIRTDSLVHEMWSASLNFQQAAAPFDNINFQEAGELPNGNYYVSGMAGQAGSDPHYIIFVFDTLGQVVNYKSLHNTLTQGSASIISHLRIAPDSSLLVVLAEYNRFGFYRLDQNLNLLSHGFYTTPQNLYSWGRDCLMLPDTSLLMTGNNGSLVLTKTTLSGALIWAKSYPGVDAHGMSMYQSPSGSVYVAGFAYPNSVAKSFLAKFDTAGNPLFLQYYNMANMPVMDGIWSIYPDGNNLMLYSDSIIFEVDTLGVPTAPGFQLNSVNYKKLKPGNPNDFIVTGLIFQDSLQDYRYTVMRFSINTVSGCLHPRVMQYTQEPITGVAAAVITESTNIIFDSIPYTSSLISVDYDVRNGCPPNLIGINESEETDLISVFPNPAADQLTIRYQPRQSSSRVVAAIFDIHGKEIAGAIPNSDGSISFSIASLANGIYAVCLYENGVLSGRTTFCVSH